MAVMYKNFGIINKVEQRNYYGFPIRSASGSIAQFSDGAPEVPIKRGVFDIDYDANGYSKMHVYKSNIITITAVQEGSGDPSPSNIRPILAGLTFEMDDASVMSVYGGTLDISSGLLTVTYNCVKLNDISQYITYSTSMNYFNVLKVDVGAGSTDFKMSCFPSGSSSGDMACWKTSTALRFRDTDYTDVPTMLANLGNEQMLFDLATTQTYQLTQTELARACDALGIDANVVDFPTGVTVYGGYYDSETGVLTSTKAADGTDLATPVEYQLQPVEIIQAQGQNNIWNDTGDTLAEYRGFSNVSGVLDCVALAYTNNNEMIFNNQYASDSPAYAVSAKNESYWLTPDPTNSYIGYKFASPVVVNAYEMRARNNGNNYDISQSPRYWIIQGSNDDGVTWENVFESGHEFTASGERFAEAFGNTTKAFKWWRMFITTAKQTDEGTALAYLMFKTISFEE